jgi:hypothetical protein
LPAVALDGEIATADECGCSRHYDRGRVSKENIYICVAGDEAAIIGDSYLDLVQLTGDGKAMRAIRTNDGDIRAHPPWQVGRQRLGASIQRVVTNIQVRPALKFPCTPLQQG